MSDIACALLGWSYSEAEGLQHKRGSMPSNASMHLAGSGRDQVTPWRNVGSSKSKRKSKTRSRNTHTHTNWTHNYAGHTSFRKQTKSCKKLQENSSIKKLNVNGNKGEMYGNVWISVHVMKPCLVVLASFGQFWCQWIRQKLNMTDFQPQPTKNACGNWPRADFNLRNYWLPRKTTCQAA